jgi:hypothetical protein
MCDLIEAPTVARLPSCKALAEVLISTTLVDGMISDIAI